MVNAGTRAIRVPADAGKLRFWRNTSVANLAAGTEATLSDGTLGYEWDSDLDNGSRPPGLVDLSSTTESGLNVLQDNGSTYGDGSATHSLTLYRASSGALVFGAGTVQWSWGLDANHDRDSSTADPRMQQATVNLFADMHSQPGSLDPSLTAASASTDTAAPSTGIVSPASGTTVTPGTTVTIQGTATDAGGGRVGGVEVSLDGGTSWHPASGRESWRYTWTPSAAGQVTLMARASDDSANLGSATSATIRVGGSRSCPCSLFGDLAPAQSTNDNQAIEVGVRFRADVDGFITGLRYYGAASSSPRVGHLWTEGGTQLASATFVGDSLVGWHTVSLSPAVRVTKDTTYVASFLSSDGTYYADPGFFNAPFDAAPLHAPRRQRRRLQVRRWLPADSFDATSYGADVLFAPTDQTAPQVTSVSPRRRRRGRRPGHPGRRRLRRGRRPRDRRQRLVLPAQRAGALVPADVTYDAAARTATLRPRAPLAWATTYTATAKGGAIGFADLAGNPLAQDRTWSFTTAAPPPGFNGPGEVGTKGSRSGAGSGPSQHGSTSSAAQRLSVSPRTVRASKTGTVKLRVTCPAGTRACRVQLKLQVGQAHRRDQDGDGGRRQDQDGHPQAEPRRPQRPRSASARCTPPRSPPPTAPPLAPPPCCSHPAAADGDTEPYLS